MCCKTVWAGLRRHLIDFSKETAAALVQGSHGSNPVADIGLLPTQG